jgi:tetratricopeptide (TPR) repeat protein
MRLAARGTVTGGSDSHIAEVPRWDGVLKASPAALGIMLLLFVTAFPCTGASGGQGSGPTAQVSGTVRTRLSEPVSMAHVTLQSYSGGFPQYTRTDTFGRFSFDQVPIGSYVIVVSAAGYLSVSQSIEVAGGPTFGLSITLRPLRPGGKVSSRGSELVAVEQLRIPEKARKEYNKGLKSAARGKIDDAIKHWKKSIRIYPKYADAFVQLSNVFAARSDFPLAMKAAKDALDIDRRSAGAYISLGHVYEREKDYAKAKNAFADAVRISDSDWLAQYCLGRLILRGKDAKGAYPHLLRAFQLNPQIPDVEIALYNNLLMLGRPRQALAKLDDFLARFPNSPLAASAREKRRGLVEALAEDEH